MANNSAGVYDGLPFSYLTNTSPTDKQPPRSPRLSSRSQSEKERGEPVGEARPSEEEAELRPFTYLTPNSPTERDRPSGAPASPQPQYLEPLEGERGHERVPGSSDLYNNPSFNSGQGYDNSRRLPRDREVYPQKEVRVGSDPNYYTSVKNPDRNWDQEQSQTVAHPQDRSRDYLAPDYKQGPDSNFELGGYASIPRPKVGGNSAETSAGNNNYKPEYQNDNNYSRPDGMATTNQKSRPLSRDSYLDPGIKRGHGCECRVVLIAVFLIILALGAGFAAGWFVSKSVNSSSDSNTSEDDSSISSTTPLMAALTSSTPSTTSPLLTTATVAAVTDSTTTTTITKTTTQQAAETQAVDDTTSAKTTTLTETDQPSTTSNNADTTESNTTTGA